MTNTQSLRWQVASVPKDKNYEYIACGECSKNETVVPIKDHVVNYTCPTCYKK